MANTIRRILNCSFILLLFTPLIIYAISPVEEISQSEKRKLATFPKVNLQTFSIGSFSKKFESYWNDHFGLREYLIAINSMLQNDILNTSPVKYVIRGQEGWLFFNLQSVVSDFLGIHPPSQATLKKWTTTLENREKWLKIHNINYLLLPVPSKMNIYSEYLPNRYSLFRNNTGKTSFDLLFDHLKVKSDFSGIIQLKPIYLKEKTNDQLYYKTDTHWTWFGAHLAYIETIKKLNRWYPYLEALPESAIKLEGEKRQGDLAVMLGKKNFKTEISQRIQIKNSCSSKMFKLPGHNGSETKRYPMVTTCETGNLTAVVSYDSFGPELFPYFSNLFQRVIYVSRRDFDWLKEFLLREKPDVFIQQQAARQIGNILNDSWELAEELR